MIYKGNMPRSKSWEIIKGKNEHNPSMLMSRLPLWATGTQSLLGILEDCIKFISQGEMWKE